MVILALDFGATEKYLDIPVFVSSKPVYCVIKGIGKVLENFNFYQRVLTKTSKRV